MVFDLLSRLLRYDAKRAGLKTFITRIIENKVASIIEYQGAAKRDYRLCTCSLNDQLVNDESGVAERIDTVDQDDYLIRTGRQSRPAAEIRDLLIDVPKIIALLPADWRELCRRLMSDSASQVARDLGISRATVYRRLKRIRALF
jgi:RNA polymerase sigma-70 factor (ECF subfamily)